LTKIAASDTVAPMNLFFYGLFSNLKVYVNGKLISDDMGLYHYKSIVPLILTKGEEEEKSILSSVLYYRDSEYNLYDTTKNSGFKTRVDLASSSKAFDMVGPISNELFTQSRYIPPGCQIQLVFTRNLPELCIESATTSKPTVSGVPWTFKLDDAYVVVKSYTVHPEILKQHQTLFNRNMRAQFPCNTISVRSFQIGIGSSSFSSELLWNSKMPTYVVIGLTETSGFTGIINRSPLNFEHHNVSSITLKCEQDVLLYKTIEVDFDSNLYQLGYQSLTDCLSDKSTGNHIDRDSYKKGYTYYAFNLLPTPVSSQLQNVRAGAVRVGINI
jgi:hypothetical protein